jgi:hypothetical protein
MAGRTLWAAFVLAAAGGAIAKMAQIAEPGGHQARMWAAANKPLNLAAYSLALYVSLRILSDYRAASAMRTAWVLMSASCGAAVLRHGYEWFISATGWTETRSTSWATLRQVPTVLALVLLTGSLIAMWLSFTSIGLRLRFRKSDALLAVLILCSVPFIFSLRDGMNDSQSVYPFIRGLQSLSPLLLAAPAVAGLALHRLTQEIGGGQLATSLRYLVASLLIRLLALMIGASPLLSGFPVVAVLGNAAFWGSHWLFLIGITRRWRMTQSASELAERYGRNPEAQIAQLSLALTDSGARFALEHRRT